MMKYTMHEYEILPKKDLKYKKLSETVDVLSLIVGIPFFSIFVTLTLIPLSVFMMLGGNWWSIPISILPIVISLPLMHFSEKINSLPRYRKVYMEELNTMREAVKSKDSSIQRAVELYVTSDSLWVREYAFKTISSLIKREKGESNIVDEMSIDRMKATLDVMEEMG